MAHHAWPLHFSAALSLFRTSLRLVPPSLVRLDPVMRSVVQPVTNSIRWPSLMLPSGVNVRPARVGGLRGEWFLPRQTHVPSRASRVLLWVHGGGFFFCSPGTHRHFLAKLASCADVPIYSVNYRKPPEFSYPTPGNDVYDTYRTLLEEGFADKVFLGGDSAGANLALCTARRLAHPNEPSDCPRGLILLSPWVDLSDFTKGSWQRYADIDFIPSVQSQVIAEMYAGGLSLKDISISPGLCENWQGFPPTLLDYGACEVFRTQIERLAAAMAREGVNIDALAEDGMVHGYPLFEFLWGPSPGPFDAYHRRVADFIHS